MGPLEQFRQTIERILMEYAAIPYSYGEIKSEVVFDHERDRYLLMIAGRENGKRVHGALVHVDIIDGKIWIQRDGTEYGIVYDLVDVGVPKDRIVPAFRSEARRRDLEFAVA